MKRKRSSRGQRRKVTTHNKTDGTRILLPYRLEQPLRNAGNLCAPILVCNVDARNSQAVVLGVRANEAQRGVDREREGRIPVQDRKSFDDFGSARKKQAEYGRRGVSRRVEKREGVRGRTQRDGHGGVG